MRSGRLLVSLRYDPVMSGRIGQSAKDRAMVAEAGRLRQVERNVRGALDLYLDVLKRRPREPELHMQIGVCFVQLGMLPEARKHMLRVIELRPSSAAFVRLAFIYEREGELQRASGAIERGLRLYPGDCDLCAIKAEILYVMGRYEDALAALGDLLDREPPSPAVVRALARVAHRVGMEDRAITMIRAQVEEETQAGRHPVVANYMLGDLLDRTGHYDEAFRAYAAANEARGLRYDPSALLVGIDEICTTWTRAALADAPSVATASSPAPIFIVGMPRSGTSLAEQIITSHSGVAAGGERGEMGRAVRSLEPVGRLPPLLVSMDALTKPKLGRLGRQYLSGLRTASRGAGHVTDKMPTNFLYLGLVQLMLPGAKVVHCVRDARDTCLSCYFQNFSDGLPFACNLSHIGVFYRVYARLMEHWKQVLDVPIFDLDYDTLVRDCAGVSRRLMSFLDLPWEDACETFWRNPALTTTASLDQIRRPMFTSSIDRWRNYAAHIEPLEHALGEDLLAR